MMAKVKIMFSRHTNKICTDLYNYLVQIVKSPWKYGIESGESLRERLQEFLQEYETPKKVNSVFLHAYNHGTSDYDFLVVNHVSFCGTIKQKLWPVISVVIILNDAH